MNIAIVGSGPSAFYTVQSFLRENPLTNIDIFKTRYDRIDKVDYIKTVFTKADYLAWMDLPANHADRDASFTIQRYSEV